MNFNLDTKRRRWLASYLSLYNEQPVATITVLGLCLSPRTYLKVVAKSFPCWKSSLICSSRN